jgi:hypothetical protein
LLAVDFDAIVPGADWSLRIATGSAIQADVPGADEVKSVRAGAVAELRKRARQTGSPG